MSPRQDERFIRYTIINTKSAEVLTPRYLRTFRIFEKRFEPETDNFRHLLCPRIRESTGKGEKMLIETTKRGFPAVWESGGGMTSGGSATVIAKPDGSAPRAVFVPRRGHLACVRHALICVHKGFYLVHASVSRGTRSSARIERITATAVTDNDGESWSATAAMETVNTFSRGEWDRPLDEKFSAAVEVAFRKASIYHCRSAMYIDESPRKEVSAEERRRRDEAARRQDTERAQKREAKAEREAREVAEREVASQTAKEAGLGVRLEAANTRLAAAESDGAVLGDTSFRWGYQNYLYTDRTVAMVEEATDRAERQFAETQRKRAVRGQFTPRFATFSDRAAALGCEIVFTDDCATLKAADGYSRDEFKYSDEGIIRIGECLARREAEAAETLRKAEAAVAYNAAKAEAAADGLPSDIRIWHRRGGRTNAGDGWVLGSDGQDRDPTDHDYARKRGSDGMLIWEQILRGEVVLRWAKGSSAAPPRV